MAQKKEIERKRVSNTKNTNTRKAMNQKPIAKKKGKKVIRKKKGNAKKYVLCACLLLVFLYGSSQWWNTNQKEKETNAKVGQAKEAFKEEITKESYFPDQVYGIKVSNAILDQKSKGRPGTKRKVKYIVIHETGNFAKGTDAAHHAKYLKENSEVKTSWHYTVDDKEVYHHIPDNEVAWHAGDKSKINGGNLNGIGVELCVNKDGNYNQTFENATKLVAYLVKQYGLTIDDVKKHGDFISKDCPNTIIKNNRMDEFKQKVSKLLC